MMEVMVTTTIISTLASTALPALKNYLDRTQGWRKGWDAGVTDQLAGTGDVLSFGIGHALRELGQGQGWWGDGVDEDSASYNVGVATGLVVSLLQGGAAGLSTGVRATAAAGRAGTTVIGRNPQYVRLGEELGANYFNIPTKVWNSMDEGQQWLANRTFLDQAIARGDEFILATSRATAKAGSWYALELEYLMYRGYRFAKDGTHLILP
jgi:hypothetical protein